MTVPLLPTLTAGEFDSLLELAIGLSSPKMSALHLTRLVMLGYVRMSPDGPQVTGDGLIQITENA